MTTARQQAWSDAAQQEAKRGNDVAAGFFSLLALPNDQECTHNCVEHSLGFSREGRRGFRCGICKTIVKWVDPEPHATNLDGAGQ